MLQNQHPLFMSTFCFNNISQTFLTALMIEQYFLCSFWICYTRKTRRSLEVKYAPRTYQNLPQGSWYFSKHYDFYATHAIL